ncbi:tetratricopeptide repeat protein [Rhizobiaceae bacterium n13]|uniref:Tetratricopeptide repeat protein n=1 Tax=Ferirhizobium litorale TaxID=2927786 RepID=A0AAE3QDF3_9HYPH|nr:adenylate/guanylate cyclase domain-containing protein [Fererhizobium litorale]MDI7861855.1 tetratricopeptide repeat protein [Fererhizobium litorale]MDI7921803.1 tetratricopeptide repeat protein [Fererhizobium litorale]
MNCSGCGFEIDSGFAFCPKCGAKQPVACTACAFPCPAEFAFCPKCGTALGLVDANFQPSSKQNDGEPRGAHRLSARHNDVAPPLSPAINSEADRRPITVLFADLCGFTALSERVDPEVMRVLQNELFEELTAAVESYDGFVDKFVGDALLALFGAPVAHEDDPERSLQAALDMLERGERFGERWQQRIGCPLKLHIGISTGPVVTGSFGAAGAKSYSVTGDTVNTAQRLQAMAGPGEIFVGPLTYQLTRHAFAFDGMGDRVLRGKASNVVVHRLVGMLETPQTARGLEPYGLRAPLIGRDAELGRLVSCLDLACAGTPQLVRLMGEAGIGKSRLVSEFLARISEIPRFAEVTIRQAVCSPLGEQPFGTLGKILRSAYGISAKEPFEKAREMLSAAFRGLGLGPEEIERVTPAFFHVVGFGDPSGALQHVPPEQMRRQIFYAVRTLMEHRLSQGPLLLIVEDLHCADSVSLEALRFLMDRIERDRFMLLTTQRPAFETHQLESSRTSLTAMRLTPLTLAEGQKLLAEFFCVGNRGLPADLRNRVLQRASGNPLFIEEIVRGLIDVGALRRDGTRWQIAVEGAGSEIPLSIQAMLLSRVDHLPPDVRRIAQEAAMIGPTFDAGLLGAIASDPSKVEACVDFLCSAEIVEEVRSSGPSASAGYRFRQTLLHDVIYQNLLLQRRTEMHAKIGHAIERIVGDKTESIEDLALLGYHFSQTADRAKGARYLIAAGERASRAYANDDAIRLYRQALDALEGASGTDPELAIAHERSGDLSAPAGRRRAAFEHYSRALDLYTAAEETACAARVLRKMGRLHWDAGRRDQAEAHYSEAAALLERTDAPIEYAHLLQERGHLAFRMGDHASAARWAEEALQSARSLAGEVGPETRRQAALATAEALNTKGVALARLGRIRDAIGDVEASLSVATEAQLLNAACRAYSNLGVLYTIADPGRALDVCRQGYDVAVRIGDLGFQARLLANLAVASCTFTQSCGSEGVPAAEKAIEIDRALDQRDHLSVPLIVLGQIHQCHGRPDLARKLYNEALEVARETGEPQLLFPCYDGLATLHLDLDDIPEAERYFTLAQDVCVRHGLDPEALVVLPFLD